ncbi:MAG: DUF4347 domain-containing protein, partial [Betaproteobacteria bacterium]
MLVVLLDANWDGVEQISQLLAAYQGLAAVQILSHGSSGALRLGANTLNSARLESLSERLKGWRQSIIPGGDLLLYGCDVAAGEEGVQFIRDLSELTGADVGASTNPTGGTALGGDWILEASTGAIETQPLFSAGSLDDYGFLLAAITLTGVPAANDIFVVAGSSVTHQSASKAAQTVASTDTLTINGGDGNDTFNVLTYSSASSTTLDGGTDTTQDKADLSGVSSNMNVVVSATAAQISVFDVNATTGANVGAARMTISNVEEFLAGQGTKNTLNLSAMTGEVLVRIIGKNKVEVSTGSGASWTKKLDVSNVQNVIGGSTKTHFVFFGAGSLDGFVDGKTTTGNVLSYSSTYDANGGTINADPGLTGPVDYNQSVNIDLTTTGGGSATSLKKGAGGGFLNIQTFIGSNYADNSPGSILIDDDFTGSSGADKFSGGGGHDLLEGGLGADVLAGGLGDDHYIYRAGAELVGDTITEAVSGGVDMLNFSNDASDVLTIEFRPFTTGAGVKATAVSTAAVTSVLDHIMNVEGVRGGGADSTYKFYDDWGRQTSTAAKQSYSVVVENAVATNAKGTLDFSAVTRDLVFTLKANGAIEVVAEFTGTGADALKEFKYSVVATDIANVKGGKGNNTFKVESATALKGKISVDTAAQASGKTNTLDYSGFSGDAGVDFDAGIATGIGTALTQRTASNEVQRLVATGASGGFRLSLAGLQTEEIQISTNVAVTASNIQAALNAALGTGATTVTGSGTSGAPWVVTFVPTVMGKVEFPLLTVEGLGTGSIAVTSQSHGQLAGGQLGIAGITNVVGGAGKLFIVDGSGSRETDAGEGGSVIVSGTANAASDTLQGGSGADLIIGNTGADSLHGGGGKDHIAGGDGADLIFGDAGDDKLAGGLGDDRLQG